MENKILKKEDGLRYGWGGGGFLRGYKGSLVLTFEEVYFQRDTGEKTLSIQIASILNARAHRLKNQDALSLLYIENGEEKKADVWHRSEFGIHSIGGVVREPFFKSWEMLIENMRLKKLNAID